MARPRTSTWLLLDDDGLGTQSFVAFGTLPTDDVLRQELSRAMRVEGLTEDWRVAGTLAWSATLERGWLGDIDFYGEGEWDQADEPAANMRPAVRAVLSR